MTAPLVDAQRLSAWAGERLAGSGPLQVERLAEGHSNLTFVVRREGAPTEWILRRPPLGPLLPTAHDVVREFRVLDLLGRAGGVRVPRVSALCEDSSVLGAPFYLMERVVGEVVRAQLPGWLGTAERPDTAARQALGWELVDTLAELHAAPYQPLVQAGIGRPDGYLARQVRRWRGQREGIETAVAATGGQARALPDYDAVRDWLTDRLPAETQPSAVVHGDYKLDNVIVTPPAPGVIVTPPAPGVIVTPPAPGGSAGPRIAAIVDWEMATVGDPLADLGYLLSFWPEPGEAVALQSLVTTGPGFPSRAELVDRYAQRSGRDVGDTTFYVTLAIWKLAILLEASYHRHLAGTADDPFFALLAEGVPALLHRAREVSGA